MKIIKFATFLLATALSLVANYVQAAAPAPISISFTAYTQVTSTNSSGVITYSTNIVTWNNATILAKIQSMGVTLPPGAKLAIINTDSGSAGELVVLDSSGSIGLYLDDLSSDTYYISIYLDGITPLVQSVKAAKLSSTVTYSGTANLYADFESYTNESFSAVKPQGTFSSTVSEDDFYFDTISIKGSFVSAGSNHNSSGNPVSGNLTAWGSGEYYHYDTTVGDTYQPADGMATVPLITGTQNESLFYNFFYSYSY